ncbi:nucleotidyltransferase domain-containing protein [Desulfofundulus thermobenzoicus]|uniref:Nucleotidyltransferase domain-containing protein n=1 Tax=Desulfofundulus thermobenzoicus TaxID=29376 RepID=A0A6N7IUA8_9FIRM|nr:nucleotidyltransferase domain-containing protein [Desulfofundulus thermobenzoicus]MQL53674.1 nucleotidyltransferase domain-containing protein [Desulfofundulus thermobenzoicus]
MQENFLSKLITFSPRHRRYILNVLMEVVNYYGDLLLGCAVFGSYARGDNRKNSDLDLLIILKSAPGLSRRLKEFVENIEMKHEDLAQEIYEEEEILCELSPYILTVEEALKIHPIYYDLVEDHMIVYDPGGYINRIINSIKKILAQSGARKVRRSNTWEWQMGKAGFPGGMDL